MNLFIKKISCLNILSYGTLSFEKVSKNYFKHYKLCKIVLFSKLKIAFNSLVTFKSNLLRYFHSGNWNYKMFGIYNSTTKQKYSIDKVILNIET